MARPSKQRPWAYEPMSVARERQQSEAQALTDQVAPLVAQNTGLSLLRAQQIARAAQGAPEMQIQQRNTRIAIGEKVRATLPPPDAGMPSSTGDDSGGILDGLGDFAGGAADLFRDVVPQGVRDVGGATLRALTSGRELGNALSTNAGRIGLPGFRREDNGGELRRSGDIIAENLRAIPGIGGIAEKAFEEASPLNVASAGFGSSASAGVRGGGGLARNAAAALLEVPGQTFKQRMAAQVAAGIAGQYGSQIAVKAVGEDSPWAAPAAIAGGFAGGAAGFAGAAGVRRGAEALQQGVEAGALREAAPEAFQTGRIPGTDRISKRGNVGEVELGGSRFATDPDEALQTVDNVDRVLAGVMPDDSWRSLRESQRRDLARRAVDATRDESGAVRPSALREVEAVADDTGKVVDFRSSRSSRDVLRETGDLPMAGGGGESVPGDATPWIRPLRPEEFTALMAKAEAEKAAGGLTPETQQEVMDAFSRVVGGGEGKFEPSPYANGAPPEAPTSSLSEARRNDIARRLEEKIYPGQLRRKTSLVDDALARAREPQPEVEARPATVQVPGREELQASNRAEQDFIDSFAAGGGAPEPPRDLFGNPVDEPIPARSYQQDAPIGTAEPAVGLDEPTGAADLPNYGRQGEFSGLPGAEKPRGTWWDDAISVLSLPRGLVASADAGSIGRQMAKLGIRNPAEWRHAIGETFKAYRSADAATAVYDDIMSHPRAWALKKAKVDILDPLAKDIAGREEAFASTLGDKLPWVRTSGRAYTAGMNDLRGSVFYKWLQTFSDDELRAMPDSWFEDIGDAINAFSGRGKLPASLETYAPALNSLFFAPKMLAGDIRSIGALASKNPVVRKQAAQSLAAFYGTGIGLLTLAAASGFDVGVDPRATDFGKVTLPGDIKLNVWGGQQSLFRALAQLATGQATSSRSGQTFDKGRMETVTGFLRGKLAPVPSSLLNYATGADGGGEEVRVTAPGLGEEALRLVTPLFVQDFFDATREGGPGAGALVSGLGAVGLGATQYQRGAGDDAAEAAFGKKYARLNAEERAQLLTADPTLQGKLVQEQTRFAGSSGKAAQVRQNTMAQQEASDQQFLTGKIGRRDWLAQRSERLTLQRGQLMALYGNTPVTIEEAQAEPQKAFLYAMQQATDPATGAVDSLRLEEERAKFGPEMNARMEKAMNPGSTALDRAYRAAASRYFDTPKYAGLTADEGALVDRVKAQLSSLAATQGVQDPKAAQAAALRSLRASGRINGVPPKVLAAVQRSITKPLPKSPARDRLEAKDAMIGFFFAPRPTRAQMIAAQQTVTRPGLPTLGNTQAGPRDLPSPPAVLKGAA